MMLRIRERSSRHGNRRAGVACGSFGYAQFVDVAVEWNCRAAKIHAADLQVVGVDPIVRGGISHAGQSSAVQICIQRAA